MKLELKHLAPYLPYGLKIGFEGDEYQHSLVGIEDTTNGISLLSPFGDYGKADIINCKPILTPIGFKDFTSRDYTYNEWCFFFENHFDVFGLIENGLAIDIKELKKALEKNKAKAESE